MALVTCGGADVLRGRILMPSRGTWVAELVVDSAKGLSGKVTIASDGGLSLSGTVLTARTGVHLDSCHLRIVGGAGGLSKEVSGAYQTAQLRDPLDEVMRTSGESLSSTVLADVLGVSLAQWTLGRCRASRALDDLSDAAGRVLGKAITWRVLTDGKVWMGAETWPAAKLGQGDEVLEPMPSERLAIIGVDTLTITPGVNVDEVGRVVDVEHQIEPEAVRTWAWL